MTERSGELTIEREERSVRTLGAAAFESARLLTATATGLAVEEVTVNHVAAQFTAGGFNEWPADVAHAVRDVLATEYGFDHI
jgi:hypothetical protein